MKAHLKGKVIVNEYKERISYKDFWGMVKDKQLIENRNHAREFPQGNVLIDGYSFSYTEFS